MNATTEHTVDTLEAAVADYIVAKRAEEAAKKARILCEERIAALRPPKEEGSSTVEDKVTLTGKLSYSCEDPQAMADALADTLAPNLIPVKRVTELDATGCKWLRLNEPQAWAKVAQFVTVKPAKASVTVKV